MAGNLDDLRLRFMEELIPDKHLKGKYICPICGSGTGKNGTGSFCFDYKEGDSKHNDPYHGHCFSCGWHGDIFDKELHVMGILGEATNEERSEAVRRVAARYNYKLTRPSASAAKDFRSVSAKAATGGAFPSTGSEKPVAPAADPAPAAAPADFSLYIRVCVDRLAGSPGEKYLLSRAINQDTMSRFRLGYDPAYSFLGGSYEAITIPFNDSNSFYEIRTLRNDLQRTHDVPRDVSRELFNINALYQSRPCFVVESALCAMSIEQEGGSAIGLGGLGQKRKLLELCEKKKPSALLILSLDNDDPGRKAQAQLAEELAKAGINFIEFNVAGPCKDPNELLQKDPALLRGFVAGACEQAADYEEELKEKAAAEQEEREKRTGAGMIDSFLQDVQSRMYEPLPTGITDIDRALDGGFMRQQLVCLGAAPGAGKTALAQWIFEGMAEKGINCIFLNLEMSRNQILARSLARYAARKGFSISSVKLLRGYAWTEEQRKAITEAAEEYKQTIAPRMIYNPEGLSANLDDILQYLELETLKAEAAGKAAPCIVLDYLQIVRGRDHEDSAEIIKRAVQGLKDFAIRHNTVVFLIIAHNRESNKSGTVTMESGRDTSAIEYSGDTQIGLTFTRCLKGWVDEYGIKHDKSKNPDDLTEKERQEITLKIVKSRFGGVGRTVNLRFNGETMTYTQTVKDFTVVNEETPFEDDEEWKPIT